MVGLSEVCCTGLWTARTRLASGVVWNGATTAVEVRVAIARVGHYHRGWSVGVHCQSWAPPSRLGRGIPLPRRVSCEADMGLVLGRLVSGVFELATLFLCSTLDALLAISLRRALHWARVLKSGEAAVGARLAARFGVVVRELRLLGLPWRGPITPNDQWQG